ncbi:MAG: pantoate--beta-alanine ligase [Bacteroidia bacterium]|nr:pantoate--beta-alanine ligase [Bacteroidia bacterium]MCF8428233.1 pantoate--beta-alanine ligase [Bacteroidia bacterium]MCF8446953.1 pantoate--beta-alanine ligase [Bacteroidia bacterium]
MILFQKPSDLGAYIKGQKAKKLRIGFVPTMGALHLGHLSLLKNARQKCDIVVCSIFVNPTQFNQTKDLETYPRNLGNDIQLLLEDSCDVLFHPDVEGIYGNDLSKDDTSDYGPFIYLLEGESRPGHFDGVVTVVRKLFEIVTPDEVFFGQKDYQQCLVVNTLINKRFPNIQFNLCPIAREESGLAMSSRNVRLNPKEREIAPRIFEALQIIQRNWNPKNWEKGILIAKNLVQNEPFYLEYLSVCDKETLLPLATFESTAIVLVAVQIGSTRLIDNLILFES